MPCDYHHATNIVGSTVSNSYNLQAFWRLTILWASGCSTTFSSTSTLTLSPPPTSPPPPPETAERGVWLQVRATFLNTSGTFSGFLNTTPTLTLSGEKRQ